MGAVVAGMTAAALLFFQDLYCRNGVIAQLAFVFFSCMYVRDYFVV